MKMSLILFTQGSEEAQSFHSEEIECPLTFNQVRRALFSCYNKQNHDSNKLGVFNMKKIAATGFAAAVLIYAVMHYVTFLVPSHAGERILSVAGIAAVIFAAINLSLRSFMVPLFLLTTATVVQITSGGSFLTFLLEGIIQMRSLIALLLIVPVIGWILREEPYIDSIMNAAHRFLNTSRKFYFGIMLVNQLIAYFLLFGCIPMMYQFIHAFLRDKKGEAWEYFKGTALLRSFALTTLWVVSIPSFAFAVDHLDASLGWTIIQGMMISLAGIGLAVWFAARKEKQYGIDYTAGINSEIDRLVKTNGQVNHTRKHVLEFATLFVSLFTTIFLLHLIMGWGLLMVIPPVIIVWTCGYFILKKRTGSLMSQAKQYFGVDMKYKSQQFSLLLAAGMLIYAVNQSGIGNYLVEGLFYLEDTVPFLNFLVILPFTTILLGFLGLGPLTVIVLVAGILQHVDMPYPPELVVLSLTSGSVISVLLSPVILPIIILSATNGLSILKNGFRFNLGYSIVFYFMVQAYIQFMWYVVY